MTYGTQARMDMARDAARTARKTGTKPLRYDGNPNTLRKIPFIGAMKVSGFKETEYFFVDSSGMGQEGERALTFAQFVKKAKKGRYYAIHEVGQFQVKITEFTKT